MAIYYVDSTATGGSNTGGSWANAYLTFDQAKTSVNAGSGGDFIYVSHAHSESLSADTTYSFTKDVQVLCVNSGTGSLATTAVLGAQATNWSLTISGSVKAYFYGLRLQTGTGTTNKSLVLFNSDGGNFVYERCAFSALQSTGSSIIVVGVGGGNMNSYVLLNNCTVKFSSIGQKFSCSGVIDINSLTIDSSGVSPSTLFGFQTSSTGLRLSAVDCDFSMATGTLVGDAAGAGSSLLNFYNCKLGSSAILASPSSVLNKGQTTVNIYNCSSGDTHYNFGHYDPFGSTEAINTIYANSGAKYDGTNGVSWKITTTANCSYWTPYVSPWIQKYHSGTSEITPRLEILRDGSSTAYYDDEVWSEWSYQGNSGYSLGVLVNDRMTPLGTRAAQGSSSLGASDWSGENATAWFGKLEPTASVTPAEIGHLMARVCVGATNATVYVDPTIRTS